MKKLSVLKYGVLLGVSMLIMAQSPGCSRMVNFYNNLTLNEQDFTAKLVCPSVTFQSDTGEYSSCQSVSSNNLTGCKFYIDGEEYGTFNTINLASCSGDATLKLTLNDSDSPALNIICVSQCGDSINSAGYPVDYDIILDADFLLERDKGIFELYIEE